MAPALIESHVKTAVNNFREVFCSMSLFFRKKQSELKDIESIFNSNFSFRKCIEIVQSAVKF